MEGLLDCNALLLLTAYNADANRVLLDALAELSEEDFTREFYASFGSIRKLLLHIMFVETYFVAGCRQVPFGVQEGLTTVPAIRAYWQTVMDGAEDFVTGATDADLQREVGIPAGDKILTLPVWQFLTQTFLHSQHHRGELHTLLEELGQPYPRTDILFQFLKQSGQSWEG